MRSLTAYTRSAAPIAEDTDTQKEKGGLLWVTQGETWILLSGRGANAEQPQEVGRARESMHREACPLVPDLMNVPFGMAGWGPGGC